MVRMPTLVSRASVTCPTPHQLNRQGMQELTLAVGLNQDQTIRLRCLGGDLGEVFRSRHADRHSQPDFTPHPPADRRADLPGRAEQVLSPSNVDEGFVDRDPLDQRREVPENVDDLIAEALVLVEVAADEAQVWTQAPGHPAWHPGSNPKRLGLVRGGEDHSLTYRNRSAAQRGVEQLLD